MYTATKLIALESGSRNVDYEQILTLYRAVAGASNADKGIEVFFDSIAAIIEWLDGMAFFAVDADQSRLVPVASRQPGSGAAFQISRSVLREAASTRQLIWRAGESLAQRRQPWIGVLPICRGDEVVALLHFESLHSDWNKLTVQVDSVAILAELCAPLMATGAWFGVSDLMMKMAQTINASIEAKDTYTSGHSERVARFTLTLAQELGMNEAARRLIYISALCHDVGKLGVSESILRKPSLLSVEEFEEIKTHPVIGARIIEQFPGRDQIIAGVRHHHERWDGTGYPDGLKGEEIPLFARIIAVADAFDAMTSGRSYVGFVDQEKAVTHLCTCEDLYAPEVLLALWSVHSSGRLSVRTGTRVK